MIKTNPYKAVSFVESSVRAALERCGYLIADTKYDGVRGNILVDNVGDARWWSRTSTVIPSVEHLNGYNKRWSQLLKDDRCIYPAGFMLDGELMVKGVDFNTGSGLLRTKWLKEKNWKFADVFCEGTEMPINSRGKCPKLPFYLSTSKLKVVLYAVVPLHIIEDGSDHNVMNLLMPSHVEAMCQLLSEYFPEIEWCLSESRDVYDMDELNALYEQRRAEGNEGLVIKDPMDFYKRGKKTGWWKMKPECEADGIIVGIVWGTEGLANEGKVIGFEVILESGRVVNATNISRALMDEFTSNVLARNKCTPEEYIEGVGLDYFNPYGGFACQISYMEETPDGSLRHPSFVMFRGTEDNPMEKI